MNEEILIKVTRGNTGAKLMTRGTVLQQLWALSVIIQSFTEDGAFGHHSRSDIKTVIDEICKDPEGMQKQLNKDVVEQMKKMNKENLF